ncbi:hypothetical protein NPIL_655781 [Nephila pilipes]|uniref:Uncharacterized protein n=1 Tax=Nephila pilipes TaxID=299642 RepID=A0A8X6JQA9_NEPPI|nr:hypothetical protein NPIL_655781 [Nephila pilipes]
MHCYCAIHKKYSKFRFKTLRTSATSIGSRSDAFTDVECEIENHPHILFSRIEIKAILNPLHWCGSKGNYRWEPSLMEWIKSRVIVLAGSIRGQKESIYRVSSAGRNR